MPTLETPLESKPVMVASASCPAGRSVISSGVSGWSRFDQIFVALVLRLETKMEVKLWFGR